MSDHDNTSAINNIPMSIKKYISNNKTIFILVCGLYFTYTILNYLIQLFRYISMPILFMIIVLKIGIYNLSNNIDNNNLYSGILLRQTFIIMLIQFVIFILNIIDTVPFINIFSLFNYISFLLILLSYLVILPTGLVNFVFKKITLHLYFLNNEILLNEPLSDKIISWIKAYIGNNINFINKYQDIIYTYDTKDIDDKNMSNLTDILDKINILFLKHYNTDHIIKFYNDTKIELKKIIVYIVKLIAINTN